VDGQGTKCSRKIAENFNRLTRAHERYRQTTDGRATAYNEQFTFAKNVQRKLCLLGLAKYSTDSTHLRPIDKRRFSAHIDVGLTLENEDNGQSLHVIM